MTASPDRKRTVEEWVALETEAAKDEAELVAALEDMTIGELEVLQEQIATIIAAKENDE
jgi:hypothetical protein